MVRTVSRVLLLVGMLAGLMFSGWQAAEAVGACRTGPSGCVNYSCTGECNSSCQCIQ